MQSRNPTVAKQNNIKTARGDDGGGGGGGGRIE
jgi:hypothetical protein